MALYIKDDEVAVLARKTQVALKAKTVTEAVRIALQHELARACDSRLPSARLASAKAKMAALGAPDPAFSMKRFSDELWGE